MWKARGRCKTSLSSSWAGHWNVSQIMVPSREIPSFLKSSPFLLWLQKRRVMLIPLCLCPHACSALGQPSPCTRHLRQEGRAKSWSFCSVHPAGTGQLLCYSSHLNVQVLSGMSTHGTQTSTVSVLSLFSAVKIWLMSQISLHDVCPEYFLVSIETKRDME